MNSSQELQASEDILDHQHDPQWDVTETDLGEPHGDWWTEHGQLAKEAAATQVVAKIGRRPSQWAMRELLPGATGDDPRCWFYRLNLKNDASFLNQKADRISADGDWVTIREARAFDYMNRHFLFRLLDKLPVESAERKAAARAAVCRTCLYKTHNLIPNEFSFVRDPQVCQNGWCCPYCYARLFGNQFEAATSRLKDAQPEFVALFSQADLIGLSDKASVDRLRKQIRTELLGVAKSAGCDGGIWTQHISPALSDHATWSGNQIRTSQYEALEFRMAVLGVVPRSRDSIERLRNFDRHRQSLKLPTEIDIQRFDEKRSLRAFMVKARSMSKAKVQLQENTRGLFYWPPMSASAANQWVSRFYLLRNQPASRCWGSWHKKGRIESANNSIVKSPISSTPRQRRLSLSRAAEPTLVALGFPKKPLPGRVKLRQLLSESGIIASERDVRWLISRLS